MEKDKVLGIFKRVLFWGGYALLMFLNLSVVAWIFPNWFYYFIDYEYWLENYTLHEWEGFPDIDNIFLLKEAFFDLLLLSGVGIGNYLFWHKKIVGFIFLCMPFFIMLIRFLLGEYEG